jgi:hypothetical protein
MPAVGKIAAHEGWRDYRHIPAKGQLAVTIHRPAARAEGHTADGPARTDLASIRVRLRSDRVRDIDDLFDRRSIEHHDQGAQRVAVAARHTGQDLLM